MVYYHKADPIETVDAQGVYNDPHDFEKVKGHEIETHYPVFGSAEKIALTIFREQFEPMGIKVADLHSKDIDTPLILVRSSRASGATANIPDDSRFIRSIRLTVSAIMNGPNADDYCSKLLEACQHVVINAWHNQTVVPNAGSITHIDDFSEPTRVTDFQTATNIVQYASLPRGVVRYEQVFGLLIRPDTTHSNPFLK